MYKRKFWPILLALIMTLAILVPAQVTQAAPNLTWEFEHLQENGHLPRLTNGDGWIEGRLLIDGEPAPAGTTINLYYLKLEQTTTTNSRGEFHFEIKGYKIDNGLRRPFHVPEPTAQYTLKAVIQGTESGPNYMFFDKHKDLNLDDVRGEVTINFVNEAGETLDSKTIVTRKYEGKDSFEFFPDEPAIAAPELSEGSTWEKEGNQAPDIDENNQIKVAGITGLANSETWTYKMVKTEVKGVLHLVFVDENGKKVTGSPIDVPTTENEKGQFVPDKTSVEALEATEGYEWMTETEGAVEVANGVIALNNVALDNADVTWTYKMYETQVFGVLNLVFVDENGVEVEGSPITVRTTKGTEGKFLPFELAVNAPKLAEGYEWVAETEGAAKVNEENYIDLYNVEFDSANVTWTYKITETQVYGVLNLVFVDENGKEVEGSPITVRTTKGTEGKFLPFEYAVDAPKLAEGYEWVAETEGAAEVNDENYIELSNVELDSANVTWTYKITETQVYGVLNLVFVDENGDQVKGSPITVRTTKGTEGTFLPFELAVNAPKLAEGFEWVAETEGAAKVNDENYIDLFNVELDSADVTWTYKMAEAPVKGVLHLVFVDKNGNEIADSPIDVATTQNTEGKFLTDKITMDAPEPAAGYEWVPETEGAAKVNDEGQIDLYWAELENDDVTWTYKMVKTPVKGVLHLIFVDENGVEVAGSRVNVPTTENEEGKYLPDQLVADAPELPEGYEWVAEEGAVRVNDEGYVDLYWAELDEDDVTWTYTKTATVVPEVKGVLHLVFVDKNGNEIAASPIDVATTQNTEGKFLTDKITAVAPEPAEGYEWVPETEGAAKVNDEGKIDLYWAELENDEVTWTYKMVKTPVKGVLHLIFLDENGVEVPGSRVNVPTTENEEGKYLPDQLVADAPELPEGYEWVAEEGAVRVNDEGYVDLYWAELENDDVTWTYTKTATVVPEVKGVLHLVFVDENGKEVEGSPIDVATTRNAAGKFLTDETDVKAPELAEGYKWVAETQGAMKVDENGKIDLYWAELENDDVTWTYKKTAIVVPEVKGVLHLVFVDENGKEVKGSPINVATTKNAAGKFLTDETIVKAPKLADGYEWVAKTKGAAKVNAQGKIDLYWVELEKDDVTWVYKMHKTAVTPVTPPEKPDEKPCVTPTVPQVPAQKVLPWGHRYSPWRMKSAPKTAGKVQVKTEAKVDSAKVTNSAVTTIPATGEARVPMTTIGLLLAAATALFLIRRKTR